MQIISIVASLVVFGMWAVAVFRLIFDLRRRAVERSGGHWPGPGAALREFGAWARDPARQAERRRLALMTVCVFAIGFLVSLSLSAQPV